MTDTDRLPVIVAAGQSVERDQTVWALELATRASEVALDQARGLRRKIDRVSMVNILAGGGPAPAATLARRLGLSPAVTEVSTIGGNSPQWLVNRAAAAISSGESEAWLVAGAESQRSKQRSRAAGRGTAAITSGATPARESSEAASDTWDAEEQTAPDPMIGDDRPGVGPAELSAGLAAPVHIYAMFESVIAHRSGRSFAEHRAELGRIMAPFTEVAAKNPFAWFPSALTPDEISEIGPENRLVSEPYTKRMCAVMGVDQGAAVVVTSLGAAREAGLADSAVFCWAGADACDVWFPSARPDPGRSPGIAAATSAALEAAGTAIDDVSSIDLYSCFPSVVEMGVEALGIRTDDERGLTVTGGLAYFGGPGNDYTLHAIATMAARLREQGGVGLVTGLGWYATKHSAGVYGSIRPRDGWRAGDTRVAQREIDASEVPVADAGDMTAGRSLGATVVAGTVALDHDGKVTAAPVFARLEDGRHLVLGAEESELQHLAGRNLVGTRVVASGSPPRYRVDD